MKNTWLILVIFFLPSCSVSNMVTEAKTTEALEGLVREYKIVFFQDCIASTDDCIKQFLMYDTSVSSEFSLGLENYQLIRSLANNIVAQIHRDSADWTNQICPDCNEEVLQRMRNNGMIGKQTLGTCLDYYTSNELDSIARANVLN